MKINVDFIKTEINDECLLVPVGDTSRDMRGVFTLNESGGKIVSAIEDGKTEAEIVEMLLKEYDSDRKTVTDFVQEFIGKLRQAGIVEDD